LIQVKHARQPSRLDQVLASILSSAIDVDKMDYLERDSAHLGVPYGRAFDAGRLIAALTLNEAGDAIAVTAKGKVSAEQFVFSRYMMFSEAYWHHAVRAASAMIEAAFADFVARNEPEPDALVARLLGTGDDALLQYFYDASPEGSVSRRLLDGMTGDRRRLHKRVATYSRVYAESEKREAYERLYALDGAGLDRVTTRLRTHLAEVTGCELEHGDVLVDTPPRDKDHHETVDVCYPNVRGQGAYPLHELSHIVAGVHHDFVRVVKKIRVFVCPELATAVRQQQGRAEEAMMKAILG